MLQEAGRGAAVFWEAGLEWPQAKVKAEAVDLVLGTMGAPAGLKAGEVTDLLFGKTPLAPRGKEAGLRDQETRGRAGQCRWREAAICRRPGLCFPGPRRGPTVHKEDTEVR